VHSKVVEKENIVINYNSFDRTTTLNVFQGNFIWGRLFFEINADINDNNNKKKL